MRTGDMYSCSVDGYYTYLGRSDDMLRVGGEWVSPAEVEAVLVRNPAVLEAAVVGYRDDDGLQRPVAFVVATPGAAVDEAELEVLCKAELAGFKRPRRYRVVDALPKTTTGKIQRYVLRQESLTPTQQLIVGRGELEVRVDGPAAGAEDRSPLVFLHEGLGSVDLWRTFPDDVRHDVGGPATVVYSRHGHGSSAVVDEPRRIDYMHHEADAVLPELLDRLGIERPVLVGHSDGASIALLYAGARRPGRRARPAGARTCSSRTARSPASRRPATPSSTAISPDAWRATTATPTSTFRGWNDVWLSPEFRSLEHRGAPADDRLLRSCSSRAPTTSTAASPSSTPSNEASAGRAGASSLPGVGHSPHLEAPTSTRDAVVDVHPPPHRDRAVGRGSRGA